MASAAGDGAVSDMAAVGDNECDNKEWKVFLFAMRNFAAVKRLYKTI